MTPFPGRPLRPALAVLVGLGCLVLSGCGSPTGRVDGRIQSDGRPVPEARVVFESIGGTGETFSGRSGDSGKYQVDYQGKAGLPVGRYQVTVTRWTLPDGKPLPAGEQGEVLKADGRAKVQSVRFEKDVAAGPNTIDFDLGRGQHGAGS